MTPSTTKPVQPVDLSHQHRARIAQLNDAVRHCRLKNSRVVFTASLLATLLPDTLSEAERGVRSLVLQPALLRLVQRCDFTPGNDPHGERDFGSFVYDGHTVFWKIDTYENDGTFQWGAARPWDETESFRVLTIMLASDY